MTPIDVMNVVAVVIGTVVIVLCALAGWVVDSVDTGSQPA